jgi:peptidoglycan-N-acetylglucosamine deacetylase
MAAGNKPVCTLSLDLDNEWSYLKTSGDPSWKEYPSYLDLLVPRMVSAFREVGVKPTIFVVGRDAAFAKNHSALRLLAAEGFEIGNHSYEHEAWIAEKNEDQLAAEIIQAEESICGVFGTRPCGFRGPGFSSSETMMSVLRKRGYRYDSSKLPTFIGPLARLYYFRSSNLSPEQRQARKLLFGSFRSGFLPIKPYFIGSNGTSLLEIPVTTVPFLRLPFHVSYILYASTFSPSLARFYWRLALRLCLLTSTPPSILLHPLDFLGRDDVSTLSFFPGMNLTGEVKTARVLAYLKDLTSRFQVLSLGEMYVRMKKEHEGA